MNRMIGIALMGLCSTMATARTAKVEKFDRNTSVSVARGLTCEVQPLTSSYAPEIVLGYQAVISLDLSTAIHDDIPLSSMRVSQTLRYGTDMAAATEKCKSVDELIENSAYGYGYLPTNLKITRVIQNDAGDCFIRDRVIATIDPVLHVPESIPAGETLKIDATLFSNNCE